MRKLGEQWVEDIDGKKHMLKAVNYSEGCNGCIFLRYDPDEFYTCNRGRLGCPVDDGMIIKDLGILNEDGRLPCPFCGEYPESFNKGNEYTKKRCSVLKCNKCHYELTVCAIYQTIEWCKEKVLSNWNRRA